MAETKRRTLVKTVMWRAIGIVWTWLGAYVILLCTPARHRSAVVISTLIVAFHHSTRMVMYYGYERAWAGIAWGTCEEDSPMAGDVGWATKVAWSTVAIAAIVLLLLIVLYVSPMVKP